MGAAEKLLKDYYRILGVQKKASGDEIKKAYRALVKINHPDINTTSGSHARFIEINEAYEILSDTQKRFVYDQKF